MKLLTLQQLIDEKAFPTSTQRSAPLVIRVDDILDWILIQMLEGNSALMRGAIIDVVPIDALTAWMAGHVRVPVDVLEAIVEVVRGMLHTAYQNAMPVCCGKPGQQCCGNPDPEWNAADMEVMDSLGPVEKRISAMLAAAREKQS